MTTYQKLRFQVFHLIRVERPRWAAELWINTVIVVGPKTVNSPIQGQVARTVFKKTKSGRPSDCHLQIVERNGRTTHCGDENQKNEMKQLVIVNVYAYVPDCCR